MGMSWTTEQQLVIDKRGCNILVAAAAGSGKTAVLVERIITRLTRDEHPLNVDELLIVTFTEAAAAEMKERILAAIEKALETKPNDTHLQKQATLIHNALITTIHSFCLSVIRNHFHTIDLDPVFRIGEEGELKLLKQDVMNQLLEIEYGNATEEYLNMVECIAPGRSDKKLEELILSVYNFSRSNPQPTKWLEECARKYEIRDEEDLEKSSLGQYMSQMVGQGVEELITRTDKAMQICNESGGPHHYMEALSSDRSSLVYMKQCIEDKSHKGENVLILIQQMVCAHGWEPLSRKRPKDVDKEKKELVQNIRKSNKSVIDGWKEKYFYGDMKNQIEFLEMNCQLIRELVRLVQAFAILYEKEKQTRGMIDFNDMEQYALRILTTVEEGEVVPSKIAKEYQEQFQEVMIDEYQDSNLVQESILTSVSKVSQGSYNIFMVGDVKQSIYRFRLSRPELFMEKFNRYQNDGSKECRIDLNKNFRSRDEVLETTNFVFYQIMKSSLGGVEYDEQSALYCGASYPEHPQGEVVDNRSEFLLLDDKEVKESDETEANSRELEARMVARRIKEMVGSHLVFDKHLEGYRPAKYSDIVLLSRSLSGWSDVFARELGEEGIPTSVENREGYFSTLEVSLLLDYLRVLDNPKQDIPLTAVLRSMFGNVTDRELAMIKGRYRTYAFCDAVYQYATNSDRKEESEETDQVQKPETEEKNHAQELGIEEEELRKKLRCCFDTIERFRKQIAYMGIHELLWEIMRQTHYREYIYALPGGEQRSANVDMLLEKATAFEHTSYKGIFNFIRYIEQLEKYQVEYGEASMVDEQEDAIRIMSIHKSKGLEFPIVFIVGMGKLFNKRDQADAIVMHLDEGIGIDTISAKKRTKGKSLMKQVIKKRLDEESMGEELRVLYVAMTRAKEKLIMTGKIRDADKKLEQLRVMEEVETNLRELGSLDIASARSYMDWVLPSVYLQEGGKTRVEVVELESIIKKELEEEIESEILALDLEVLGKEEPNEEMSQLLGAQLEFQYAYGEEQNFKLKVSVTEMKRQALLRESANVIEELEEGMPLEAVEKKKAYVPFVAYEPEFMKKQKGEIERTAIEEGAFRGTTYHRFLELWDFQEAYSEEKLLAALDQYKAQKKMSEEMIEYIQGEVIQTFMETPIAKRMQHAAREKKFYKEQPFVLGVPATQVYGIESEETILIQGIIDVYFEEEDGLVLLDYKTDGVNSLKELEKKYHTQLEYYAQALEQLTGKRVKEKLIYSLRLQQSISI